MEEIALRTRFSTVVNPDEVRKVLGSALRNEAELASARRTHFEHTCRAFEQQHRMSSEEFMQQFESGALGDDAEYFDWYAAKRANVASTCGSDAFASCQGSRFERTRLLLGPAKRHPRCAARAPFRRAV